MSTKTGTTTHSVGFGLETKDADDDDDDDAAAAVADVDGGFRFLSAPLLPPVEPAVSVCLLHKFPQPSA